MLKKLKISVITQNYGYPITKNFKLLCESKKAHEYFLSLEELWIF